MKSYGDALKVLFSGGIFFIFLSGGGAASASQLWPMQVGQKYLYEQSDPLDNNWPVELTVNRQTTINSTDYFGIGIFNAYNEAELEQVHGRSTENEFYSYNPDGDDFLDYQKAPVGTKWSIYQPDDEYNYKVIEIVAIEPVTVPYGTFNESYKYRKYQCVDPDNLGLGQSPDWYEWVVPGVGWVKQVDYWVDGPAPVVMQLTDISLSVDINHDGINNLEDFAVLAEWWLDECSPSNNWCEGADFDLSGQVGMDNLAQFANQWTNGKNIADHVFDIEFEIGWDYGSPDDPGVYTYDFVLDVETDDTVIGVEFTTPAGNTFIIPYDSFVEESAQPDGLLTLGREYDWDTGRYDWEYQYEFYNQSSLAAYGDGLYTLTIYYSDGCWQQTTAWFGIPGTTEPIPQPTQQPVITSFDNGDTLTSPVTFTWQACTDPAVQMIHLEYENQQFTYYGEHTLSADATGLESPVELEADDYDVYLDFRIEYDSQNTDGIPVRAIKWSEGDYQITVINNTAPVVDAGTNQVTTVLATGLDGTVTDDGLANPRGVVTTLWTQESGPGTVTFGDASSVDRIVGFSAAGR